MRNIRDIKRKMRRDLHLRMRVKSYYVAAVGYQPKTLHVRIHTKMGTTGMDSPTNSGDMTERAVIMPKILFMLDELAEQGVRLRKGGIVSVEAGEAYELEYSEEPDGISQSWFVTQLDTEDTVRLPVPPTEILDDNEIPTGEM